MNWQNFRLQKRLDLSSNLGEAIYATLAEIDGVKISWHITKKILPQTIERLVRSVIITATGSSNRIEGNNLTDVEVENLYNKLRIKKFKTRDEQEVAGLFSTMPIQSQLFHLLCLNGAPKQAR